MKKPYFLMAPGPVQIPNEVLIELGRPMIHHRTPEFDEILKETLDLLKKFFCTTQPVYMLTATGSGAMEAAIVNTLSPGDKAIVIVSGKFGERWRDMCRTFGVTTITLDLEWGKSATPEQVQNLLTQHPDTKVVMTQVCETSTGALHPIRELSHVIKSHPNTLFMVDAITAAGVVELKPEDWGIDVVVAGSQKAFMLPTGMSFITFTKKAWTFVEKCKMPRFYFDVRLEKKANEKGETYFSSSVAHVRGLRAALKMMLSTGLDKQILRTQVLSKATREASSHLGFKVFAESPSPSVTALLAPTGVDTAKLRDHLEQKHYLTLAGGQDAYKGRLLRIGHLGHIGPTETRATIERIADAMIELGHSVDKAKALQECDKILANWA